MVENVGVWCCKKLVGGKTEKGTTQYVVVELQGSMRLRNLVTGGKGELQEGDLRSGQAGRTTSDTLFDSQPFYLI